VERPARVIEEYSHEEHEEHEEKIFTAENAKDAETFSFILPRIFAREERGGAFDLHCERNPTLKPEGIGVNK
jgi:hypothetical protein